MRNDSVANRPDDHVYDLPRPEFRIGLALCFAHRASDGRRSNIPLFAYQSEDLGLGGHDSDATRTLLGFYT